MSYESKDEIALWKNDNRASDRHPHLKGSATVNGVEYWASAWKSDGKNERAPLLKISLTAKEEKPAVQATQTPDVEFEIDDDLPF